MTTTSLCRFNFPLFRFNFENLQNFKFWARNDVIYSRWLVQHRHSISSKEERRRIANMCKKWEHDAHLKYEPLIASSIAASGALSLSNTTSFLGSCVASWAKNRQSGSRVIYGTTMNALLSKYYSTIIAVTFKRFFTKRSFIKCSKVGEREEGVLNCAIV